MIESFTANQFVLALVIYLIGVASPGPSNLAIMNIALTKGRWHALVFAFGVTAGSLSWGLLAAFGLTALLAAYIHLLYVLKIMGALYLFWLASKSLRSAFSLSSTKINRQMSIIRSDGRQILIAGATLHLTNPKAIFIWLSIVSFSVSNDVKLGRSLLLVFSCGLLGLVVFCSYAFIFSTQKARNSYLHWSRWLDSILAVFFGFVGLKLLSSNFSEN